ncbi:hypothetical protein AB0D24_40265 [Streptomyces javensis]|uniref:hypothetical protein n=1 Tax=Streptomyces javensis TaxID=114698 RepID=UPI0033E01329
MRARELAELFPFVTTDDDAINAARLLAEQSLPALLVSTPTASRTPSRPAPSYLSMFIDL